jgi:hypothetical protein
LFRKPEGTALTNINQTPRRMVHPAAGDCEAHDQPGRHELE